MKRFAKYTRCSTEEQGQKFSHKYQKFGLDQHPMVRGWVCVGTYSDTVSGRTFDQRPDLDKCYEQFKAGGIDFLLVYRWDRLGRDVGEAFRQVSRFQNIGVEINCPDSWIDFGDANWPILLGVYFGSAQAESIKISERTKAGIYQSNLSGSFTGKCPPGYKRIFTEETRSNGKRVKIIVQDEKAELVREVFELYATGDYGKEELRRMYGRRLSLGRSQFTDFFHSPLYIGEIHLKPYKGQPARVVTAQHEPIISRALWEKVQQVAEGKANKGPRTFKAEGSQYEYYLKGVLTCIYSGKPMTAYSKKKKSGAIYHYYQTPSIEPTRQLFPVHHVHQSVHKALGEFEIRQEKYLAYQKKMREELDKRLGKLQQERKRLIETIEASERRLINLKTEYLDQLIPASEYRELKDHIVRTEREAKQKLEAMNIQLAKRDDILSKALEMLKDFRAIFRSATPDYKNKMLRVLFPEGFSIDPDTGKVRTPVLNEIACTMARKSEVCEWILDDQGKPFAENPVLGGQPDKVRTIQHAELFRLLAS